MEKALEIKRKAQRLVQSGDLDGAVTEYERLLAADATDPYLYVTLGDLVFKQGRGDDAGRRYREAAEAYERSGLIKNAIAVCKKMVRLNLQALETTRYLGELHAQDGLSREAVAFFKQFAEQCIAMQERRRAAEALERALQVSDEDPKLYERAGELWGIEGETLRGAELLLRGAERQRQGGNEDEALRLEGRAEEVHPGAHAQLALGSRPVERPPGAGSRVLKAPPTPAAPRAAPPGLEARPAPAAPAARPQAPAAAPRAAPSPPPPARPPAAPALEPRPLALPPSPALGDVRPMPLAARPTSPPAEPLVPSENGAPSVEELDRSPTFRPPAAGVTIRSDLDGPFGGSGSTVPTQAVSGSEEDEPAPGSSTEEIPPEVAAHLDRARELLQANARDEAADALLVAARAWEGMGGLAHAAAIYHELAKSPQAGERLYRQWLANCEHRQEWAEAAMICCELGDLALAAQEPAAAHEWFVQARAYDVDNVKAARRLERLAEWDRRQAEGGDSQRITIERRMPENLDVNLSQLLSAFRSEVQKQVAEADAQSRYDLGITYRQMGLVDEAVAEFRLAARDPSFQLKAGDMLSRCHMERGDFTAAIGELEKVLGAGELPLDAELNFRYNLGLAFEASGRPEEALAQFEFVFETEPNYPDVALKIRELRR